VRHECARDRVRWLCDPGAQIVLRPGQPGLLQGIGIRKSRYGCGGSPDNACEARTEGTRPPSVRGRQHNGRRKPFGTGNLHSLPEVEVRKNLSKCSSRNQPKADAIENKSRLPRSTPDNAGNSKTCRNVALPDFKQSTDEICNIYHLPAKPGPQATILTNAENSLLALAPGRHPKPFPNSAVWSPPHERPESACADSTQNSSSGRMSCEGPVCLLCRPPSSSDRRVSPRQEWIRDRSQLMID